VPSDEIILPEGKHKKITRLRKLISTRMHRSSAVTAPVTIFSEVDVTEVVLFRNNLKHKENNKPVPSYNAIFMKAVGLTLLTHPGLNSSLEGDEQIFWNSVNVGIAIDTARGLVVPVIRNVNSKELADISLEIKELAKKANLGKLLPDHFVGGTFTITNLGSLEVDFFTPIINYPQVGILGIGRIRKKLGLESGNVVEKLTTYLSLTFDHRIIDGVPAAKFLKDLGILIASNIEWMGY
jgi:pyruvate dehydrogenase E2 component (dihydrolipoamide acetyltransferase)